MLIFCKFFTLGSINVIGDLKHEIYKTHGFPQFLYHMTIKERSQYSPSVQTMQSHQTPSALFHLPLSLEKATLLTEQVPVKEVAIHTPRDAHMTLSTP